VPAWELTISRSPAIAGVDGFLPGRRRRQRTRPLCESSAKVTPAKLFT
jgi:hypothetical protein